MPKATFTPENKTESALDFPKLKLEKDERARIVCLEPEPVFEYIHTLRAPKLVDGKAVYEDQRRQNGEVSKEMVMDFIGRPICMGDYDVVSAKGTDPANCPMCALAVKGDLVRPPERRFAMHVMRYGIKPGGFEVASPYNVRTEVWSFGDNIFNKLTDFASEHGDLRLRDLLLGPCTVKAYQKFDINISSQAVWVANDQVKAYTVETYRNNQAKDLSVFCGRKTSREYIEQDLDKIIERTRQAYGQASGVAQGSLDVDQLLSASADMPVPAAALGDLNDLLSGIAAPAPVTPAVAPVVVDLLSPSPAPQLAPEPQVAPQAPVVVDVLSAPAQAPVVVDPLAALLPSTAQVPNAAVGGPFDDTLSAGQAAPAPVAAPSAPAPTESFDDLLSSLGK